MQTLLSVSVENFLSFRRLSISLGGLSVLVGPNGSGKTNFLQVFKFLGEVSRVDLLPAIDSLGGIREIAFRGEGHSDRNVKITLEGLITEHSSFKAPDEYKLSFWERRVSHRSSSDDRLSVRRYISRRETIVLKRTRGRGRRITLNGSSLTVVPIVDSKSKTEKNKPTVEDRKLSVQSESSGLSTIRKLGDDYGATQVDTLATVFEGLRLYEIDVEKARMPAVSRGGFQLESDASNLSAYIQWLAEDHPDVFKKLCEDIKFVLPSFEDMVFESIGGAQDAVVILLKEKCLRGYTPLGRASFGTIRAIALFAMLHDPNPPKLTCLEEVDHGLHPHALDRLVERLREASSRTQIIVATHSPALVNRLSANELKVFERDLTNGGTRLVELDEVDISRMQEASGLGLGELWFSGTLGGGL